MLAHGEENVKKYTQLVKERERERDRYVLYSNINDHLYNRYNIIIVRALVSRH